MKGSTREVDVPEAIRVLSTLDDVDFAYGCALRAPSADAWSAEQWARSVFEGAPLLLKWLIVTAWVVALRLRLESRRSPDHVLGWTIVSNTPAVIVLGVESFMLTALLVVEVRAGEVLHATIV